MPVRIDLGGYGGVRVKTEAWDGSTSGENPETNLALSDGTVGRDQAKSRRTGAQTLRKIKIDAYVRRVGLRVVLEIDVKDCRFRPPHAQIERGCGSVRALEIVRLELSCRVRMPWIIFWKPNWRSKTEGDKMLK